MLAARRDPIFDHGAHNVPSPALPGHAGGHAAPPPTGFSRFISGLQILGTVLGVPLGLASGYSIYHANFSTEARCQGLRANIVSMLDKSADASTLRMLIGRDVKAFEQSCGTVDPDAVAAFRTLLAANKPAIVQAVPKVPGKKVAVAKPTDRKPAEVRPVRRENADAKWLAAVREALVSHHTEPPPAAAPAEVAQPLPPPVAPPMHAMIAPALPVASVPPTAPVAAAPPAAADHPVPPALIPDAPPVQAPDGSRLGALITHLPLMRGMFGR